MQDPKQKRKLSEKYIVADEWVMPFEVAHIIGIPGYDDKTPPPYTHTQDTPLGL